MQKNSGGKLPGNEICMLAGEKESPSSVADDHLVQKEFLHGTKRDDGQARSVFS